MKKSSFSEKILKTLSGKAAVVANEVKESTINSIENDHNGSKLSTGEAKKAKYAITRAMGNLEENGLIESLHSGRQDFIRLTKEGKQKLLSLNLDNTQTPIPASWDGAWRIILLDLPESRKTERDSLRYLLKKAGFIALKNSAWISPYPFEPLFINLKKDLGLTTEMMVIKTESLDEETEEELLGIFKK